MGVKASQARAWYIPHPPHWTRSKSLWGGSIELVPHSKQDKAPFVAYVNEEGLINDLPQNVLGAMVLYELGFILCPPTFCIYGPVVIMGKNERSLTDKDRKLLEETVHKVIEEDGGSWTRDVQIVQEEAGRMQKHTRKWRRRRGGSIMSNTLETLIPSTCPMTSSMR